MQIYFDNGATSYPKPDSVINSVTSYLTELGASPGRSGHSGAMKAGQLVFKTRKLLAKMYGISNPMRVIMCFNATDALNLAIRGFLNSGDHVVTTSMEHNSVLRPLKFLEEDGVIELTIVSGDKLGKIDPENIRKEIKSNTSLVVVNHVSNVNGAIQPIEEIGSICKERDVVYLIDAAQSGGVIPFSINDVCADMVALTGHKSLFGPTGTGALLLSDNFNYKKIKPLRYGGTGSHSDSELQPDFLPDCFESGTLNIAGISGLLTGIEYVSGIAGNFKEIQKHKESLLNYFIDEATEKISGFRNYTSSDSYITGVVSFKIDNISVTELSSKLNDESCVMCRQGLHCAPLAHKTLGTYPEGTIRFSFGLFNNKDEIDYAIEVLLKCIA